VNSRIAGGLDGGDFIDSDTRLAAPPITSVDENGIRLSPAYDMNPSIERRELTLAINEIETACDVSIAMEACTDYGLSAQQAGDAL
jgi:hypothetical protein